MLTKSLPDADNFNIMKRFRLLSAALAGTFIYVLVTVFCGRDGFFAERQQREQKRILSTRTEKLQKINDSLTLECTALENDPDVIKGLAKKLGYLSAGDKIVKINGLSFDEERIYDAGTPIKAVDAEYLPEWVGKAFGIAVGFVVYLYLLSNDIKNGLFRRRKNKTYLEGIPVYDLPQI